MAVDGCVVVPLTGADETETVVRWAARHAWSHDDQLLLAAIAHTLGDDVERRISQGISVARRWSDLDGLAIRTAVLDDRLAITDQLGGASMVVVDDGAADSGELADLLHPLSAPSPVTVVRGTPGRHGFAGAVLAGISTHAPNTAVLGYAFEEASRHGVELIVTHAWTEPDVDPLVGDVCDPGGTPCGEALALAQATAGWQELFPDVVVRRHCEHGDPVDALVRDAEQAQVVVIGGPTGDHVAEVWRRLVRHVPRPVTLVPSPSPSPSTPVTPPAQDKRTAVSSGR